jgi:hypothetical protein
MKTPDPTKAESSAPDSANSNNPELALGRFPIHKNTVTAEVLTRLLEGGNLTGMDAVNKCSTTRLAAAVHYLERDYGWTIDRTDIDVGTTDGRIAVVKVYYLRRTTIRRAFEAGALAFCSSVKTARATTRKHAPKAKKDAAKRNAARAAAAKFEPSQRLLFGRDRA